MIDNKNSISKYIPNFVTLLSLTCGFTSIRFSFYEDWKIAVYLILLASVFDFFDGWFARKLKEGSNFGAELDSLSDFVSFGVAPSVLIFLWSTNTLSSIGWAATLFFVICAALRLARFTADIYITNKPIDDNEYFVGIPSPAAAGIVLVPLFLYFEFNLVEFNNKYLNLFIVLLVGFLMISKIPTLSLKKININKKFNTWFILIMVIVFVLMISKIWLTLSCLLILYIFSIFYTIFKNRSSIK